MTIPQKKNSYILSIRLTPEERAQLEEYAAGMSLSDYARPRIFNQNFPKRKTRGKHPVKDHKHLAKILGVLGSLGIFECLKELAQAARVGTLEVTPDTEKAIQEACQAVIWIKNALIRALGLQPVEDGHDP